MQAVRLRCTRGPPTNCDAEIDTLKQSIDAEADRWTAPTNALLEQFKNVVEELAKLPTGRTLILVSDGFNIDPKREFYRVVSTYLPNSPQFKLDDAKHICWMPALESRLRPQRHHRHHRFTRQLHALSGKLRIDGRQRFGRIQRQH